MRRARPQRSNIMKFLEEIGYEDIFDGNEVKEIKDMLNKNSANMTKNELMLESIQKFEADPEEEIKEEGDTDKSCYYTYGDFGWSCNCTRNNISN